MFSKRGRDVPDDPNKRLRANISDLFLANHVSAERAQSLAQDAVDAGASQMADLARAGNAGASKKNVHRDLLRACLKGNGWPRLYWADVRVGCSSSAESKLVRLPFLLPHELVHEVGRRSIREALLSECNMSAQTRQRLQRAKQELGCEELLGVGMWADGIPCNWDRSKSLEALVLSLPGVGDSSHSARMPMFAILKHHTVRDDTYHDVMNVLSWSLRALATGRFPSKRHDSTPFESTDSKRSKVGGLEMSMKAALVEFRGDWACYKQLLKFPQHNERAGCCWRCDITPDRLHEVGEDAPWRAAPLSHWGLWARWAEKGITPSPIFSAPCVRSDTMVLDWLHIADLGVTSDFAGNLFAMTVRRYPGHTQEERCKQLYADLVMYYQREKTTSRLDTLTPTMIQASASASPKLRAKAAEARLLVPFLVEHAEKMLGDSEFDQTVKRAARELSTSYSCLSKEEFLLWH